MKIDKLLTEKTGAYYISASPEALQIGRYSRQQTNKNLLKAALPILEEIYLEQLEGDKRNMGLENFTLSDFIDYLRSLVEE